jgi:hypothetical protein
VVAAQERPGAARMRPIDTVPASGPGAHALTTSSAGPVPPAASGRSGLVVGPSQRPGPLNPCPEGPVRALHELIQHLLDRAQLLRGQEPFLDEAGERHGEPVLDVQPSQPGRGLDQPLAITALGRALTADARPTSSPSFSCTARRSLETRWAMT